ncbi:FixH family protein [Persephonella sp.]
MIKRFFIPAVLFLITVALLPACSDREAFKKEISEGPLKVVIISDQPPHVGINKWKLKIYLDGKPVEDAVVSVNGYMPPMPGMPEMSFDYPVRKSGNLFLSDVNLSMGGTWQITITVKTENKEHSVKFGFNL